VNAIRLSERTETAVLTVTLPLKGRATRALPRPGSVTWEIWNPSASDMSS
jgi:hypothetical protein